MYTSPNWQTHKGWTISFVSFYDGTSKFSKEHRYRAVGPDYQVLEDQNLEELKKKIDTFA